MIAYSAKMSPWELLSLKLVHIQSIAISHLYLMFLLVAGLVAASDPSKLWFSGSVSPVLEMMVCPVTSILLWMYKEFFSLRSAVFFFEDGGNDF